MSSSSFISRISVIVKTVFNKSRCPLYCVILVVFYQEYVANWLASRSWDRRFEGTSNWDPSAGSHRSFGHRSPGSTVDNSPLSGDDHSLASPKVGDGDANLQLRIMIVADPQLQGRRWEPPGLIGWVSRLDADWYLWKCFRWAYGWARPDVIVFLGDLLDEGSVIDSDEEYLEGVGRFERIFKISSNKVARIYIPGDNDIGGEREDVNPHAMKRFAKWFPNTISDELLGPEEESQSDAKHESGSMAVNFLEANVFTNQWKPILTFRRSDAGHSGAKSPLSSQRPTSDLTVLFSHVPLIEPAVVVDGSRAIVGAVKPGLIISAHSHKAAYHKRTWAQGLPGQIVKVRSFDRSLVGSGWVADGSVGSSADTSMRFNCPIGLDHSRVDPCGGFIHEIVVPACSYRMGVPDMGFGLVILNRTRYNLAGQRGGFKMDENVGVSFTILWSPGRFAQLVVYLLLGVLVGLWMCLSVSYKCFCKGTNTDRWLDYQQRKVTSTFGRRLGGGSRFSYGSKHKSSYFGR